MVEVLKRVGNTTLFRTQLVLPIMFHILEQQRDSLRKKKKGGERSFKFHADWNLWFLNILMWLFLTILTYFHSFSHFLCPLCQSFPSSRWFWWVFLLIPAFPSLPIQVQSMGLVQSLRFWGGHCGSGLAWIMLDPTYGWENRGKESLKAPVHSLNYQVVLLSQKLTLGSKFQVARRLLRLSRWDLWKIMGTVPHGLGSLLPPNVTKSLSRRVHLPPALCPLWGRVAITAQK